MTGEVNFIMYMHTVGQDKILKELRDVSELWMKDFGKFFWFYYGNYYVINNEDLIRVDIENHQSCVCDSFNVLYGLTVDVYMYDVRWSAVW